MDAIDRSDALEQQLMRRVTKIYARALKKALRDKAAFLQKIKAVDDGTIKPPQYYVDRDEVARWRQGYTNELMRQSALIDGIMQELNAAGEDVSKLIQNTMLDIYDVNRKEVIAYAQQLTGGAELFFAEQTKAQLASLLQAQESPFSRIAYRNLGQNPVIRRRLQNEMAQAVILGESQQQIIRRIRRVTGQSVAQARRVAQTERTRIQSQARQKVMEEAAKQGVVMAREWTARMVNTRDTHAALNHTVKPVGEPFVTTEGNRLMYPGDPSAPAREVINCHCVLVPVVVLPEERSGANVLIGDGQG